MLYVFFWVIPLRLNFRCRRFGTLCSIFIGRINKKHNCDEVFIQARQKEKGQEGGVRGEEQAEGGNDPKWRPVVRQVRERGRGAIGW